MILIWAFILQSLGGSLCLLVEATTEKDFADAEFIHVWLQSVAEKTQTPFMMCHFEWVCTWTVCPAFICFVILVLFQERVLLPAEGN